MPQPEYNTLQPTAFADLMVAYLKTRNRTLYNEIKTARAALPPPFLKGSDNQAVYGYDVINDRQSPPLNPNMRTTNIVGCIDSFGNLYAHARADGTIFGMLPGVAKQVTRPVRNREASARTRA